MRMRSSHEPLSAADIHDYAFIGNGRTGALISCFGSVDWLCFPRFDSPSLFGALLDQERGGRFCIRPIGNYRITRHYLDNTNVLETRFTADTGSLRLTDLMTVFSASTRRTTLTPDTEVLRLVTCESGEVDIEIIYQPRPNYARRQVPLIQSTSRQWLLDLGDAALFLHSAVPLEQRQADSAYARATLRAGQSADFTLVYSSIAPLVIPPLGDRTHRAIDETARWWRQWTGRVRYDGPYREAVVRSALTLKLLFYSPSGAVLAAPTTSLPECLGGSLNWDYRYCWLRDAAFTVRALQKLGFDDEAAGFVNWLLHATAITRPELRVLYNVYGIVPGPDRELPHLAGFQNSRPVRIGNTAAHQTQLDVYGEVIDAVARLLPPHAQLDRDTQSLLRDYGSYVCRYWQQADAGIWEERDQLRHYTQSKALCWVALDRLMKLADAGILNGAPIPDFSRNRELLRNDIEQHGWSKKLQSYRRAYDEDQIDSALLLLAWYEFAPPASPRAQSTVRAVDQHLGAGNGLIYRNRVFTEGAFAICSFWIADILARGAGTLAQSIERFEQMLAFGNDLGLFAEEIDPRSGAGLGNFPQAYTHVGLINAALSIHEREQQGRGSSEVLS